MDLLISYFWSLNLWKVMTANFRFWYLNVEPNVFVERLLIYYNASICSCNLDSEEAQINVFVKHECTTRNFTKKLRTRRNIQTFLLSSVHKFCTPSLFNANQWIKQIQVIIENFKEIACVVFKTLNSKVPSFTPFPSSSAVSHKEMFWMYNPISNGFTGFFIICG